MAAIPTLLSQEVSVTPTFWIPGVIEWFISQAKNIVFASISFSLNSNDDPISRGNDERPFQSFDLRLGNNLVQGIPHLNDLDPFDMLVWPPLFGLDDYRFLAKLSHPFLLASSTIPCLFGKVDGWSFCVMFPQ
jgi:hypothetical protein